MQIMNSEMPTKEKGAMLEDTVGDLFRSWGFDIEKRVRLKDRYDVDHEIDVLCSKKEVFGTVKIAVECKYVNSPIDIKEIRNFKEKLDALSISKGTFISTGGFTSDAYSYGKAVGLELWDLATLQQKMEKVVSRESVIDNALALDLQIKNHLLPNYISGIEKLQLRKIELKFLPYYFVDYHCFSQNKVGGNDILLESRGTVILSAIDGKIHDLYVQSGNAPLLRSDKLLYDCSKFKPKTMSLEEIVPDSIMNLIEPTPTTTRSEITETEAKRIVQMEIVKNLSICYQYSVGRRKREKNIMPKKKDVEVEHAILYNIPFVTVLLSYKNKEYQRQIQGATLRVIEDAMSLCSVCSKNPSDCLCYDCGNVACKAHEKKCEVCSKMVCDICAISKGIMFKKHYCKEHKP